MCSQEVSAMWLPSLYTDVFANSILILVLLDADKKNGGCEASRETVASFQQGRQWPATSLALALSEDGATIFAGEGGTRSYTN